MTASLAFYSLALSLVLLAPILGLMAALIVFWHVLKAGTLPF